MKNVKLFGAVLGVALLTGCPTTGLPTDLGNVGKPGFQIRVTKNNQPVNNKTIFLKKWNGGAAGTFQGTAESLKNNNTKTDSNGNAFLPVEPALVAAGGLFGVGYDAGDEKADNKDASKLTDEIQWFHTAPVDLNAAATKTSTVNLDLAWAIAGFEPRTGATVAGSKVDFRLPTRPDATEYEVTVNAGTLAGGGARAFTQKGATPTFTWNDAKSGNYTYTGKFFTAAGQGGVQASSPVLVFTVTGAQ